MLTRNMRYIRAIETTGKYHSTSRAMIWVNAYGSEYVTQSVRKAQKITVARDIVFFMDLCVFRVFTWCSGRVCGTQFMAIPCKTCKNTSNKQRFITLNQTDFRYSRRHESFFI
jgi:hypothetical protein